MPKFVTEEGTFDHDKLFEVTYQATLNLNKIIDGNFYPVEEARNSNMRHRPIGLGVQGLADAFIMMRFPFESPEAKQLNAEIFETIYYAAMTASKDLAKKEGAYETFQGSPLSKGVFQFDMWNVTPSTRWEWDVLRKEVMDSLVNSSILIFIPQINSAVLMMNSY